MNHKMSRQSSHLSLLLAFFSVSLLPSCTEQNADPDFTPSVEHPSYRKEHPKVLFDEAHNNMHRMAGTYRPFVELLAADGYSIVPNRKEFSAGVLQGYDILVISNSKGKERKYDPAFTERECDVVEDWVRQGGSLLLIADHYPFGSAAEILSRRFGVRMSNGFTNDSAHCDPRSRTTSPLDGNSQLIFSRENSLLGYHPITVGRDSSERVNRVITFTGQSISGPPESVPLLNLPASAYDVLPDSIWETKEWVVFTNTMTRFGDPVPAAGRSQGMALTFGKGRVVVLGEAAMLTAQVSRGERFGMQVPGIDNRQLALNVMHWLSRLI